MFPSIGSSQSNSGFSGSPSFGLGNQKGDAFDSKPLCNETLFGFPPGMPNYGGASTWASGQTSSPLFSTTFGAPSFSGFGSSMTALGSSSSTLLEGHSSCCKCGCSPVFTQKNQKGDSFASISHGTSNWTFGQTSLPFSTPTTFGVPSSNSLESSNYGGSRIADYRRTAETTSSAQKLVSISAMPTYKDKSHEELRWEDYKFNGRGGFGICSSAHSKPVANFYSGSWGTTSNSTNLVKPIPFGNSFPSVATETTTLKYPGPTHTPTWKYPGPTSTSFTSQPLHFPPSAAPSNSFNPFAPTTTLTSTSTPTSSSSFSSPTFAAFTSSLANTPSSLNAFLSTPIAGPFTSSVSTVSSQVSSNLNQPTMLFNPFVPSPLTSNGTTTTTTTTTRAILDKITYKPKPSSLNDIWPTPIAGPFTSSVAAPTNSVSVSFVSSGLSSNLNQPTTLFNPCVPSTPICNVTTTATGVIMSSSAASPFGTLPPKPQMFSEGSRSIQYGISSIPVKDKPAHVKYPLTTRHLSRRNKLPIRKYDPKLNGPKIPYFSDTKEIPVAAYLPRENPRALIVSSEMWSPKSITGKIHEENLSGSIYEKDTDEIKTCSNLPSKLQQPDYYTIPPFSELEAKEKAEPGFCGRIKDFVIGHCRYGSIKFLGETDVRNLDLETHVQFNNREVIVYADETNKPRVGEGLNKPAEITLLNIKCIDKKSGKQYIEGSKIDRYTEMLKREAVAQGAEFISYDPVEGEWKFRVQHF